MFAKILAVFGLGLVAMAGPARAVAPDQTAPVGHVAAMKEGPRSRPPLGYVQYCRAQPIDCRNPVMPARDDRGDLTGAGAPVTLDARRWSELVAVNRRINRSIVPRTDRTVHGVADLWSLAPRAGDCEDFALTKRRALQVRGWPARALLIAIARDHHRRQHAVLIARTDHGDLVLDNLRDEVVAWTALSYRWIKRQSIDNPRHWVELGGDRAEVAYRGKVRPGQAAAPE